MIVLGNGESRRGIDLTATNSVKIGCNAAHRDMHLDHLVCVDSAPLREAATANLSNTVIWTRAEYASRYSAMQLPDIPTGNQRPDQARHWGSGPYAVLLATSMSSVIHMIGFDLYSKDRRVNNIYKNTNHYAGQESHAVDPSYWIYQVSRIMQVHNDKYFVVYNDHNWSLPSQWHLDNVVYKTLDTVIQCV